MTKITLIILMISTSFLTLFTNHPISMMLMIMIQTIWISLILIMLTNTTWFSFILFIMFISGMMILFFYICSIIPNSLFSTSMAPSMLNLSLILITISIFNWSLVSIQLNLWDQTSWFSTTSFVKVYSPYLIKLYSSPSILMTIFMFLLLFLLMIMANKFLMNLKNPTRKIN
uniref:NADH dehydrogenase subunit 6 n=1 Tax=Dipseudopsis sp. XG-2021 TaxID=2996733 RepID=A0A9E8LNS9_9NEOP|nr:NADH dehydrogenase subunit 6 [Dipseudopsis sp. XG-2021]